MNFAKTIVRASTVGLVIAGSRCLRLALFERRPISTNSLSVFFHIMPIQFIYIVVAVAIVVAVVIVAAVKVAIIVVVAK